MTRRNRPDLEISEDMEFQRRMWVAERVAWAVIAAVLLPAALGLFGSGVLGSATAAAADRSLVVSYDRFWRLQAATELRVDAAAPSAGNSLRIWLDRQYLESMAVSGITPEPERVEAGEDRLTYVFTLSERADRATVEFRIEPERPWSVTARLGLDNGDEVRFRQFIYP